LVCFCSEFLNPKLSLPKDASLLEFSGFYILFNLLFSRFCLCVGFSAATFISYHADHCLSTTFFISFFDLFSEICPVLRGEYYITKCPFKCQLFFQLFSTFFSDPVSTTLFIPGATHITYITASLV